MRLVIETVPASPVSRSINPVGIPRDTKRKSPL